MKYDHDIAKSAEHLRRALPLMSKQAAALHPISYSVWYEFVSGINPGLKAELDEILAKGEVLTEATTHALFHKYIAEIDEETAEKINSRFQKTLTKMSESAQQTGEQASQFGTSLEQLSEGLSKTQGGNVLDISDITQQVLGDTRSMQDAVASLKERLEESRREAEELKQEISRAREDALIDGLTGLTNRKGFDKAIAAHMASPELAEKGLSILMSDIDHFKSINDTYGHLFGDKVIRAIAQIISQNVKGKDTAARYGGEEFVILLPDTPIRGAQALAETIRKSVEMSRIKRTDSNETIAKITVSFGVASYIPGESGGSLIERADKALYESKHQGRNRVTLATDATVAEVQKA